MLHAKNLSHPKTIKKIQHAAYCVSKLGWSVAHVANRRGEAFLAVRKISGPVRVGGVIKVRTRIEIRDRNGRDVSGIVKQAIQKYRADQYGEIVAILISECLPCYYRDTSAA